MRSPLRQRTWAIVAVLALALFAIAGIALAQENDSEDGPADSRDQHCPDHRDNPKVEAQGDPAQADETITVDGREVRVLVEGSEVEFFDENGQPIVVEFCIKAADEHGGVEEGHRGEVTWTSSGGQAPDISYVVVYAVVDEPAEQCPGTDGNIDLEPEERTNPPETEHTVTATVTDNNGDACDDANVRFEVSDDGNPMPSEGDESTDSNGEADFTFSNDQEATNTITACTGDDGSLPTSCDEADHVATATKHWEEEEEPPAPDEVVIDPEESLNNKPGTDHTVTVTVTENDEAVENADVRFEVWRDNGEVHADTGSTDGDGEVDFTYTGPNEDAEDRLIACTNKDATLPQSCTDENGTIRDDVVAGEAIKTWGEDGAGAAVCRQQTVNLLDETLVLFQANEQGDPCETDDGSVLNGDQVKLVRSETDGEQPSATGEALALGSDDPGRISVIGTRTDCDDQDAHLLLIEQQDEEQLRLAGEDDPLPNVAQDDDNGLFLTRTDEGSGTAQAIALRLDGDNLLVVSQAETRC